MKKQIVLQIALHLSEILRELGADVFVTRESDIGSATLRIRSPRRQGVILQPPRSCLQKSTMRHCSSAST